VAKGLMLPSFTAGGTKVLGANAGPTGRGKVVYR